MAPSPSWWVHSPQMPPATPGINVFSGQLPAPAAPPRLGGHRVALPALNSHKSLGKIPISCPGELSSLGTQLQEHSQHRAMRDSLSSLWLEPWKDPRGMGWISEALLPCVCSTPKPSPGTPSWGQWQASVGHVLAPIPTCRDKPPCSALFRFPFGNSCPSLCGFTCD